MTPDIIYTYQVIGDVMMEQMDNLLLVDTNDERRQQLETVLSFMGIQWQSGGKKIVWLIFLRWKVFPQSWLAI